MIADMHAHPVIHSTIGSMYGMGVGVGTVGRGVTTAACRIRHLDRLLVPYWSFQAASHSGRRCACPTMALRGSICMQDGGFHRDGQRPKPLPITSKMDSAVIPTRRWSRPRAKQPAGWPMLASASERAYQDLERATECQSAILNARLCKELGSATLYTLFWRLVQDVGQMSGCRQSWHQQAASSLHIRSSACSVGCCT